MTTFGESLQALAGAQKPLRGAPAYSRWVNRPFGRVLAALAARLGWSPDRVTLIGSSATALAVVLIAVAPRAGTTALVVPGLLVVGYGLDAADGQLARLLGRASAAGEWLDHVLDAAKLQALHLAVVVCWWGDGERGSVLAVPLVFAAVSSTLFAAQLVDARVGRPGRRASVARSLLVAPTDYGVLCWSFALWWHRGAFTFVYAALAVATLLFAAAALPGWYLGLRGPVRCPPRRAARGGTSPG